MPESEITYESSMHVKRRDANTVSIEITGEGRVKDISALFNAIAAELTRQSQQGEIHAK